MPGYFVRQLSCHNSVFGTGFRITGVILCGLLSLGCLFGCAGPAAAADPAGKLLVAATIVPLGDFCQKIGGDLVQVQVLIPPGASPHAFEPPPSVMARASQTRVFVYIGAGMYMKRLVDGGAGSVSISWSYTATDIITGNDSF